VPKLSDLFNGFPTTDAVPQIEIEGIAVDSRHVKPGDIFFAVIQGVDRYKFLDQVVERGAAAVVGERSGIELSIPHIQVSDTRAALAHVSAAFFGQPASQLTVIGVTGTDGKTTTSNFIYHILQAAGHPTGEGWDAGTSLPKLVHWTRSYNYAQVSAAGRAVAGSTSPSRTCSSTGPMIASTSAAWSVIGKSDVVSSSR